MAVRGAVAMAAFVAVAAFTPAAEARSSSDARLTQVGPARRDARAAMRHARGAREHSMVERLLAAAEELNLSDTQKDKLRAIRRSAPAILMPKRQAVAEARLDLSDLMARKDANAADLRSAHERLVQARSAMSTAMFDLRMQAREVLSPQQREKLRDGLAPEAGRRPFRQGALLPPDGEPFAPDAFAPFDLDPEPGAFDPGDSEGADI